MLVCVDNSIQIMLNSRLFLDFMSLSTAVIIGQSRTEVILLNLLALTFSGIIRSVAQSLFVCVFGVMDIKSFLELLDGVC